MGGTLTCLISLLTILATISFGQDIYQRKNPTILLNKNFIDPERNVTNEMIIGYRLFYTGGVRIADLDRLVDIFILHTIFDPKLSTATVSRYEVIKCSQADVYKNNYLNLTSLVGNPDDYFCLPNNASFLLRGKYGAPINNHMHLRIGICKNTTANGNRCYADDVIRKKMTSFFVSFIYKDSYIDGKDFENPVKSYITSNTLKSSAYTFRQDAYLFKDVTFNTDQGFILPDEVVQDYSQLDTILSGSTAESQTEVFTNVIIGLTNLKDFYTRKYIKVQDVSAQVGGIIKLFLIFSEFFISFFAYVPFLESLYQNLYDYGCLLGHEKENKMGSPVAMHNSEANMVLPNYALKKNMIPNLNAERSKININEVVVVKNFNSKITPTSYSCWKTIFRCFLDKKKKVYFDKISHNYTKIFDVERIFKNDCKVSCLFDYSFNSVEQELIRIDTVMKFFECEKNSSNENIHNINSNTNNDHDSKGINSKIFHRLNIPRSLIKDAMLLNDNNRNQQECTDLRFHSINK